MRRVRAGGAMALLAVVGIAPTPVLAEPFVLTIASDPGDGSLSEDETPLTRTSDAAGTAVRVGVSGTQATSTRTKNNAIFFFELPGLVGGDILGATLSFPYFNKTCCIDFAVDLWGLGYVSTPALDANWLRFSNSDGGAGLGVTSRTKIQADILAPGSFDPDGSAVPQATSVAANTTLMAFVQSLYAAGAGAGDFAVFRLNPDRAVFPEEPGTPGYSVGFSEYSNGSPELTLTLAEVPEPGSLLLLLTGGVAALARRRRGD